MTRRDLMTRIGSDELSEWLAFDRIEPLDDGYWQAARICLTMAQAWGGRKNKATLDDFLPVSRKPRKRARPTWSEVSAILGGMMARQRARGV
jgi:hypothetical protein